MFMLLMEFYLNLNTCMELYVCMSAYIRQLNTMSDALLIRAALFARTECFIKLL